MDDGFRIESQNNLSPPNPIYFPQYDGDESNKLMFTTVPIVNRRKCVRYKDQFVAPDMTCAGYTDVSSSSSCSLKDSNGSYL